MSASRRGQFIRWIGYLPVAAALAGCAVFSVWLRKAPPDSPLMLLAPTARLAGALSGVRFGYAAGTGYCGWARDGTLLIIEKSCSGGNFLVILFSLLAITQLLRLRPAQRPAGLAGLFVFSLLSTVVASSLRIAASVPLLALDAGLSPVLVHNVVGIATYLTCLCLCYGAAGKALSRWTRFSPERTVDHG